MHEAILHSIIAVTCHVKNRYTDINCIHPIIDIVMLI